ncbi:MAG TPA: VCBS repeat-containing protein [Planctomycetaceae bacterium]|nr:VCBS repeat-containing protein [Planctomycetaceae bacterium]
MKKVFALILLCSIHTPTEVAADDRDLTSEFGFSGVEIYKVSFRSGNLLSGDFNNDSKLDLIVVDNSHSRIDLFQQRSKDDPVETEIPLSANEIVNDRTLRHRKLPVDRQISAMTVGDFNADGRTDIAYFGQPDRLMLMLQAEDGKFESIEVLRVPDVAPSSWTLDAGDLNGDKLDDLVVLGKNETWVLYQQDQKFQQPVKLLNTSDRLAIAQIADLDGDGRNDLCYLATEGQDRVLCARLQDERHRLGPELQFDVGRQRSLTLHNIDGKAGEEILSIDPLTNRVKVLQLERPEAKPGELAGKLVQYGFGGAEGARDRDIALGDVDGDGKIDLVATDPTAAQVYLFQQSTESGLDLGQPFPGLQGASQIRLAKLPEQKTLSIFTLSTREKAIGVSAMEEGRLSIPKVLPVVDEPLALEIADLDRDGSPEVLYIARQRAGRSSSYLLRAMTLKEGDWISYLLTDKEELSLELASSPSRLSVADVNRDGLADFLIAQGSERPQVLIVSDAQGKVAVVEPTGGFQLGQVEPGAIYLGTPSKPATIVAQANFARSFALDDQNRWQLQEQFNAAEANAKLAGSAVLDLDGEPGDEIVLVDTGVKRLRVMRKEESGYRPWKEVDLGNFPFLSAHVADLNGDGADDLLLFGGSRFAVLYAGRTDPKLREIASFETQLDKVFFADLVAGDLNGDGSPDLIALDTRSHYLEILDFDAEAGLRHALHFTIFEQKSFTSSEEGGGSEPREGLVVDVTGDGLDDLVLLIHDRVLVYPQDRSAK